MFQVVCKATEIRQYVILGEQNKYNYPCPDKLSLVCVGLNPTLFSFQPTPPPSFPPLKIRNQCHLNHCQSLALSESPVSSLTPLPTYLFPAPTHMALYGYRVREFSLYFKFPWANPTYTCGAPVVRTAPC